MIKSFENKKQNKTRRLRYVIPMVIITMGFMIFFVNYFYSFPSNYADASGAQGNRYAGDEMEEAVFSLPEEIPTLVPDDGGAQEPGTSISAPGGVHEPDLTALSDSTTDVQEERRIDPNLPMVALTFDDGPVNRTNQILDILEEHNVVATFYVLGMQIENHSDTLLRAHNLGSEIANHSWSHKSFDRISDDDIRAQLHDTNAAVEAITGVAPANMRAPYGRVNDNVRNISEELGLPIVLWSVDPSDFLDRSPESIYYDIMSEVRDRDIILLHDIHARSVYTTRLLIPSLIESGFQLVTVSELMYYSNITPEPGAVYRNGRGDGRGW